MDQGGEQVTSKINTILNKMKIQYFKFCETKLRGKCIALRVYDRKEKIYI